MWHGFYRTQKIRCGYGYEGLTEVPEVSGTGMKVLQNFKNSRVLWHGRTELPEVPGRYKHAVPMPRVFVAPAYRASRSAGYGYECPTEVTEVLCVYPTDRTKIERSGTGMNVVHNSQTFQVRVGLYRTHSSPGYG